MLLLRNLERVGRRFPVPVLTLGNFDGVHLGHQAILRRLVTTARTLGGSAVVLTFQPHPAAVLAPTHAPRLITDWRTRVDLIAAMGVDATIVQHFTRAFSQISAEEFVRRFLVAGLGVRAVVVGHRVSFGHARGGSAETLRDLGTQWGFDVEVIGPVEVNGVLASSSAVRRAIGAGDFAGAHALLGRIPSVVGRVIHGHHRGHMIGFPTANLRIAGLSLPPDGVYAVRALVSGVPREGVANLGFNPTFQEHERSLEVHVFDLNEDLYGSRIEVRFARRLRGEVKFPNVQALAEQIARDAAAARQALAESPEQ